MSEIFALKNKHPSAESVAAMADELQVDVNILIREGEGEARYEPRHRANRQRALEAAEHALGDDPDAGNATFRAAELIYKVMLAREDELGRPVSDDDSEFWSLIDSMVRAWLVANK